jgi:hypothetical protein
MVWPHLPSNPVGDFETRHHTPEGGALLAWALSCVEALHYLVDFDATYDATRWAPGEHNSAVIDVAHARWATGTSVTALDLCAAAFGRAYCKHTGPMELDLGSFVASGSKRQRSRWSALPPGAQKWLTAVDADPAFAEVKAVRDALTHRRLPRRFYASVGSPSPDPRLDIDVGSSLKPVGQIVLEACSVSTEHVVALIAILPSI